MVETNWNEDVIVYLLSDPTNIDSKMVTFVADRIASPKRELLFAALYRKDPTQASSTQHPLNQSN